MPINFLSAQELNQYFRLEKKRTFYDESVELAKSVAIHANGEYPKEIIEERRPNEPEEVKSYREKIWVAKTKSAFDKVISSLGKIRRSSGWAVTYEDENEFTRIPDDETLQNYCELKYPAFTSLTNWVFAVLLKKYLTDPNGIIFVHPKKYDIQETEFIQPICTFIESENILELNDDFILFVNKEGSTFTVRGKSYEGKSFWYVTKTEIIRIDQINNKGDYAIAIEFPITFDYIPFVKLKSIVKDQISDTILYESRISGMIPELDEAAREYSDLQAAKVLHIYPERWEYSNKECTGCKGTGRIKNKIGGNETLECTSCGGSGYVVSSPYSKIMVKPAGLAEQQIPTPPAGYVEKDVEIVKLQETSVQAHIYNALSSINFEFLMQSPMNQSGIAKAYDKDELNNTVHSIAEDIIAAMDSIYFIISLYRYSLQYSQKEIMDMVPEIPVPEKFDLVSYEDMENQVGSAKTNKLNPVIVNKIEMEYANKRFANDKNVRENLELVLAIDPLQNISVEEKNMLFQSKAISKMDFVISSNINQFVDQAIGQNENFYDMERGAQMKIIQALAQGVIDSNSAEQEILGEVTITE